MRVSARTRWLTASASALAALLLSVLLVPCFFPTNDDAYIQQILAGTVSGEPSAYTSLCNAAFSWLVSRLFVVAPGVPWWAVVHLILLAAAMVMLNEFLLGFDLVRCRRFGGVLRPVALAVLDTLLFAAFIGRLQFTTTSSLVSSAGLFCLPSASRGGRCARYRLACCLMVLAGFCVRDDSGYPVFGFWALAVAAFCIREASRGFRPGETLRRTARQWIPLVATGAVALCLVAVHTLAYSTPEWKAYMDEASVVHAYPDYPMVGYDEDPGLYESQGWDRELSVLAKTWYNLDSRFNAETVSYIAEHGNSAVSDLLQHPLSTVASRTRSILQPVPATYLALFFAAVLVVLAFSRSGADRLLAWLVFGAVMVLLGYLLVKGRLPDRAMYSVLFPAFAALLGGVIGLRGEGEPSAREAVRAECEGAGGRGRFASVVAFSLISLVFCAGAFLLASTLGRVPFALLTVLCVVVLVREVCGHRTGRGPSAVLRSLPACLVSALVICCGAFSVYSYGRGSATYNWYMWQGRNVREFYQIAEDNPDTLYIHAGLAELTNMDPWLMEWPVNQTSWAAWFYPAPWFDQTLKGAGFKGRPTVDDLFDDDVRFVTDKWTDTEMFLRYLRGLYGESVQMQELQTFGDDITIWKIVR